MRCPAFLARVKYRFDLGSGFFAVVNFALLVIAAGDKLAQVVHVSVTVLALVLVPSAIFGVWLLGYILDKLQFAQAYTEEANTRNDMLKDVHAAVGKPGSGAR